MTATQCSHGRCWLTRLPAYALATVGGNLLQRTRCVYFQDVTTPCNKREPESGCSALTGYARYHAVLGASEHCVATHLSDMTVALTALDAVIEVQSENGPREIPIADFYRLPGDEPSVTHRISSDVQLVDATPLQPDPRTL